VIVLDLIGIGIGLLWLMDHMDNTIKAGDQVSFLSRVTGTRIFGEVVRHVDRGDDGHEYIVQLRSGRVTVPARKITKECA
jgi:hypothetical protein